MLIDRLRQKIKERTPKISEEIREDFFVRMDPGYFPCHTIEEIVMHLGLLASVDPAHPIRLSVQSLGEKRYRMTLAGFDYFSQFAIFCGHIASFGLEVEAGEAYTYAERARKRKRVIDQFRVRNIHRLPFDQGREEIFFAQLASLIALLEAGQFTEARAQVNRRWVEQLSPVQRRRSGPRAPMKIRFDHTSPAHWTSMEIQSVDTPGFLFSLANTLSLRNLYIRSVEIQNDGPRVLNRFVLRERGRRKLSPSEQATLRVAAVLIQQFMDHLIDAPDPALAMHQFDLLIDQVIQKQRRRENLSLLGKNENLDLLARTLGASHFLWEDFLRMQVENLLPILKTLPSRRAPEKKEDFRRRLQVEITAAKPWTERRRLFNRFKDREIFRIDMTHLADPRGDLIRFSEEITFLAEALLEETYRACRSELEGRHGAPRGLSGRTVPFALMGLGKFGGRELGYASDIELLLIYAEEGRTDGRDPLENSVFFNRLAAELLRFVESKRNGIFEIDLRLRPFGSKGPLATSFAAFRHYFSPQGSAAPFERQALIKLRRAAGDERLGKRAEAHRDRFVYSGAWWDLGTALHLRERQIRELVPRGRINAKFSPGGIIDIEYAVQFLQIEHGASRPEVRSPATLEALGRLSSCHILSPGERNRLQESYLFLRRLIDALRIVRGNATDLLLPDPLSDEFTFLARRLGYLKSPWWREKERLQKQIEKQMGYARRFFESRFLNGESRRPGSRAVEEPSTPRRNY